MGVQIPVTPDLSFFGSDDHAMSRWQSVNLIPESLVFLRFQCREGIGNELLVHGKGDLRVGFDALYPGGKKQEVFVVQVIEGFESHVIAGTKKLVVMGVPDGKGKGTHQVFRTCRAVLFIDLEYEQAVGDGLVCFKIHPQLIGQLLPVVDAGIGGDDHTGVGIPVG